MTTEQRLRAAGFRGYNGAFVRYGVPDAAGWRDITIVDRSGPPVPGLYAGPPDVTRTVFVKRFRAGPVPAQTNGGPARFPETAPAAPPAVWFADWDSAADAVLPPA